MPTGHGHVGLVRGTSPGKIKQVRSLAATAVSAGSSFQFRRRARTAQVPRYRKGALLVLAASVRGRFNSVSRSGVRPGCRRCRRMRSGVVRSGCSGKWRLWSSQPVADTGSFRYRLDFVAVSTMRSGFAPRRLENFDNVAPNAEGARSKRCRCGHDSTRRRRRRSQCWPTDNPPAHLLPRTRPGAETDATMMTSSLEQAAWRVAHRSISRLSCCPSRCRCRMQEAASGGSSRNKNSTRWRSRKNALNSPAGRRVLFAPLSGPVGP